MTKHPHTTAHHEEPSQVHHRSEKVLGFLPPLPDDILDLIVKYGPWLVLVGSIFATFNAIGSFGLLAADTELVTDPDIVFVSAMAQLTTAIVGLLAFIWLHERRALGWWAVVALVGFDLIEGLLIGGFRNVPWLVFSTLVHAYVLLQVKDDFSE